MAAFMTLCEKNMGIQSHFNLWNYIFHARLQQGSDAEAVVLGNVDIFLQFGPRVDPYFHLPMSDPPLGWRNVWFFLRNGADAPLLMFMGSRPIPQPKWGMVWPRKTSTGCNPYVRLSSG
jgi:hypothetical protein